MNIAQAIVIIEEFQADNGYPYILEALQGMQEDLEALNEQQLIAYRVFMMMGQQFFAAA